jgi:hypothetical protein
MHWSTGSAWSATEADAVSEVPGLPRVHHELLNTRARDVEEMASISALCSFVERAS